MAEKRKYELVFSRGWAQMAREQFGIDQVKLLRIARSGGIGLPPESIEIYRYLWENRLMVFRPCYLKTFERNDKMFKIKNNQP